MPADATAVLAGTAPGRAPLRTALSTPALRRCQAAAAVARLVDMTTLVVVSVHLFSRAGGEAVAAFVAVRSVMPAIGTTFIMAAVGRRSPGRALRACALVAGAASVATALLVGVEGATIAIVALGGVAGVALCCLRPLVSALLPSHISSPAQLLATNAAASLVDNACTLAGPLLAGAALATVGPGAALWASAVLLVATGGYVRSLDAAPVLARAGDECSPGVARAAVEGLSVLALHGPLRLVTLLSAGQTFVRGAVSVLAVGLAIESLGMGDGGVGVLLAAIGVGGLLGLPVAVRVAEPGRMGRALGIAVVLWGAPVALVALTSTPAVALALFAVIGLGNDLVDITTDTLLQRLVPRRVLPCVLGAFDAVLYAGMSLGAVAAERLTAVFGLERALVIVGLVLPVLALVSWGWLRALDRRMRDRDTDVVALQVHGIFSTLVMSTVDHLAGLMERERFVAGDVIIRKGDDGDRFLLIEEGRVEITDDGEVLAVLGPGDGFGEVALLDSAPRNATAVAASRVQLRSLHRHEFLAAIRSQETAHEAARLLAEQRRRRVQTTSA